MTLDIEIPMLGFCIPTYKRPNFLLNCVRSIIKEVRPYNLPIFIVDDSADDTNNNVLKLINDEYENVVVYKNHENIGIDRNILMSVDVCECEYAWVIGEDDLLVEGAVDKVLSIISQKNWHFIFSNYSYVSNDYHYVIKEKAIEIEDDIYLDAKDFLIEYSQSIAFIGACIINKDKWSKVAKSGYVGTYFAHVSCIFESIFGGQVILICNSLVLNRAEGSDTFSWTQEGFKVFRGWGKAIRMLEPFYGEAAIEDCLNNSNKIYRPNSLWWFSSLRASGFLNLKVWLNDLRNSNDTKIFYKIAAFLMCLIPKFIFKFLRLIYRYIK